jgi:hypothetical protein
MQNNTITRQHSRTATARSAQELTVPDILSVYRFSRYEYRTLLTPDGRLAQPAMLVQHPIDPNDRFIVTANYEAGREEWAVQCPRRKDALAGVMIEAVRTRVAVNRSVRRASS